MMRGGGGSNFIPAFDELLKMKNRPDVIIAITDGMISVPEHCPSGVNVVWVLVGATQPPAQWGSAVVVTDD